MQPDCVNRFAAGEIASGVDRMRQDICPQVHEDLPQARVEQSPTQVGMQRGSTVEYQREPLQRPDGSSGRAFHHWATSAAAKCVQGGLWALVSVPRALSAPRQADENLMPRTAPIGSPDTSNTIHSTGTEWHQSQNVRSARRRPSFCLASDRSRSSLQGTVAEFGRAPHSPNARLYREWEQRTPSWLRGDPSRAGCQPPSGPVGPAAAPPPASDPCLRSHAASGKA